MKIRNRLCTLMLMASLPLSAFARQPVFSQADLFQQGETGVNTYRIPALVETAKGTLIAVVDARRDSSQDLPAHISLVMRRSFDGGKSWEPMRTILAVEKGGVGDASLLLDRSNGRVWCFHAYGPPGIGFRASKPGTTTGETTLQVHAMYSDDDGVTWSSPVDLTPQIKEPQWQAMFTASGTDIQTSSGRLLVPLVVRDEKGVLHSLNAYSDDHGKTWKHGAMIGEGTDESHNVELKGAVILQNMRDGKTREVARSSDGGVSFGPMSHDAALIDPGCNAGITRYRRGKIDALLFTNAASARRENLSVKVSYDGGQTWPVGRTIHAGPSAYSTVIVLRDGSIGVLYEEGKTDSDERITFARFDFGWIAHARD
ncbi:MULTISPECIES: exo-alpha-sialidase [Acidobacteriaceae]|uniref:sialidase family protein n=1 Tax=Acidobacteriaceae TaxID=204434 RepID=UPI00131D9FCC|nr:MULTISPECIES: sialidase family protein [Acidobacteriaceae]MDW5266505.1 sialidase family protein [Edaphobacter sp.]